eukprot:3934372-Karenia_brevis.AAC.1
MEMLNLPQHVFQLKMVQARKENTSRIQRVLKFFRDAETPARLRKAALCLQLTQHAVSMTAQTKPCADPRPLFVRLAQREVQKHTAQHLKKLIPLLNADPKVELTSTVFGLLTTQGHLVMRFQQYADYP